MDENQINPLYIKGFNAGYLLSKHDPELLNSIFNSGNDSNEYFKAMHAGRRQNDVEALFQKTQAQKDNQKSINKKRGYGR